MLLVAHLQTAQGNMQAKFANPPIYTNRINTSNKSLICDSQNLNYNYFQRQNFNA
jgi:hypothetical protein